MKKTLVLLAILVGIALPVFAETPGDTATRVQNTYDAMTSLRFKFHQRTSGEMTGRPQQGSGWAVFLRSEDKPKMRWEYLEPDSQVIVSDGVTLKMYFQKLNQMIETEAQKMATDITYSFFTGRGNLSRDFQLSEPDAQYGGDETNTIVIKLIPRYPQQQVQDIHLWIDELNLIRRIAITDHFGTVTSLNLSQIEVDALDALAPEELGALFLFTPPENTEIIEQ